MRICFVTTEYPGLTPSGGIGTYVETLTKLLDGHHQISIFISSSNQNFQKRNLLSGVNATFYSMFDTDFRPMSGGISSLYAKSLAIYDWLKTQEFDKINFPDWGGLGAASIQAKRAGVAFTSSELTITLHGPELWTQESNNIHLSQDWNVQETHRYLEFEAIYNADRVFAPSKYILNWVESKANRKIDNAKVIINPFIPTIEPFNQNAIVNTRERTKEIIFFGRLEPRKGVEIFLRAIELSGQANSVSITLLGRNTMPHILKEQFSHLVWFKTIQIIENYNTKSAMEYVRQSGGLVVVPSLDENCPYSVQEIANLRVPFIASNVGGIPELVSKMNLVEPEANVLSSIFYDYSYNGIEPEHGNPLTDFSSNNRAWIQEFNENLPRKIDDDFKSIIGVVVAHYNQSQWLEAALNSIKFQSYSNFECVVIDDGSLARHREEFVSIKNRFKEDDRFKFLLQDNSDVGATRNNGARITGAHYLIFHDADDIMGENCLALVGTAFQSGADVVTSHFSILDENFQGFRFAFKDIIGSHEPFGGATRLLWRRNVVGGANLAITRTAFSALGGWNPLRGTNHQDWRILTKAKIAGFTVRVIPERLLGYRVVSRSMTRTRNFLAGQLDVISEYQNLDIAEMKVLLSDLMASVASHDDEQGIHQFQSSTERIVRKIQKIGLILAPYGSWRWRKVLPLYRRISK